MAQSRKDKGHSAGTQSGSLDDREGRKEFLLSIFDSLYSAYGPQHWWPVGSRQRASSSGPSNGRSKAKIPTPLDGKAAFEVAVGAILTQNTAWANVEKAIQNLRAAGCLSPEDLRTIPLKRLGQLLRPSGYFNIKAKRLKSFVRFLDNQYGGDIGKMFSEKPHLLRQNLLAVKGIGPETADSILLYAGGIPWFVVDAYTKRIFSRHGLVEDKASYQDLQDLFMMNLPKDTGLYNEYHALVVHLGKEVCRPKPLCEQCPLLEPLGKPVFVA
jgi:endonuclease III related protein